MLEDDCSFFVCGFLERYACSHQRNGTFFFLHSSNSWAKIAAQLPGRTANCVKNKWHGSKKIRRAGIIGASTTDEPPAKKRKATKT